MNAIYLGCSTLPVYFEPTFTLKGILIAKSDVRPPFAVEGRRLVAVTHLALARSLNYKKRHSGVV